MTTPLNTASGTTPNPHYSPTQEAERLTRLAAAEHLLTQPYGRWLNALINRAPGQHTAHHLDGALHVLTHEGWTQNRFVNGGYCLLAALTRAADLGYGTHTHTPDSTYLTASACLDLMIHARTGTRIGCLTWNDTPGRTLDEVLELVTDAAAFARTHA